MSEFMARLEEMKEALSAESAKLVKAEAQIYEAAEIHSWCCPCALNLSVCDSEGFLSPATHSDAAATPPTESTVPMV